VTNTIGNYSLKKSYVSYRMIFHIIFITAHAQNVLLQHEWKK